MKKLITLFSLMLCILATAQENVDGEYMYIFRSDKSVERIPIAEIDSVTFVEPELIVDFGLPRVYVATPDGVGVTSKTVWLENCSIRIVDESGVENLNVKTSIRGRGNTLGAIPRNRMPLSWIQSQKCWVCLNISDGFFWPIGWTGHC
jgi:hypothetical protein